MTIASDSVAATRAWPPSAPRLLARALGRAEDLDIDFAAQRPYVVTQVLERCVRDTQSGEWAGEVVWGWSVRQRTQALLAVAHACEISSVAALARCPRPDCAEQIELEFELESFADAGDEADHCTWRGDAAEVVLRLPRGDDQRRWLDSTPADPDLLPVLMGTSLVREVDGAEPDAAWRLPETWLAGVEAALAEHDPTTDLTVAASCPRCDAGLAVEVDLESLLLERLSRIQQALLFDVHLFASRYHWSEAEVLALPPWRRAYYLAAIRA